MLQYMPFGLTMAPWIFSRVVKPLKRFLRRKGVFISSFLDDFLIVAVTKALATLHTTWAKNLLQWLGFRINHTKSSVVPLQEIEYLGVLLNLRRLTMALPLNKVEKVLSMTRDASTSLEMTRRELERLVGYLNFAAPTLPLGRLHLIPLVGWMNQHTDPLSRDLLVPIDAGLRAALRPFRDRKFLLTPVSFRRPHPDLDIMTDASGYGWSGVLPPFLIKDSWTPLELSSSINWRELKAVFNTIEFLRESLSGKVFRIHTDNQVALFCMRRMGSIRSGDLNDLSRRLLLSCRVLGITLVPVHIKGILNVLADQGSRDGPIPTE